MDESAILNEFPEWKIRWQILFFTDIIQEVPSVAKRFQNKSLNKVQDKERECVLVLCKWVGGWSEQIKTINTN